MFLAISQKTVFTVEMTEGLEKCSNNLGAQPESSFQPSSNFPPWCSETKNQMVYLQWPFQEPKLEVPTVYKAYFFQAM